MARNAAPTAAMRRMLASLSATQAKARPVMIDPAPEGFEQLTREQQIDLWEQHAKVQQATLVASSEPDRQHVKDRA